MKKLLILFLFSYLSFNSIAQQYIPFPTTSNAVWRENAINLSGLTSHQFSFYEITIIKDTIINAFTYHELGTTGWGYEMIYFNGGWHGPYGAGVPLPCCGAIREDGQKKIYYYDYNDLTEYLLYDFNLSIGDTLPPTYINWANTNFVTAVDSININGQYHKQFHIAEISQPTSSYARYIEGVGSTLGLLGGEFHETVIPLEVYSWSICFKENGSSTMIDTIIDQAQCDLYSGIPEKSYTENDFVISPNPTSGKVKIRSKSFQIKKVEVYNAIGDRIVESEFSEVDLSTFPRGIYFVRVSDGDKIRCGKVMKD